ncbi:MAG: hypothetical protein H6577_11745 [Lewinellaceae bacterium]|nr:hypothetical protein [Saprospiraceae bacterium]MCB9338790.1 hypothetical protein [Lewinellaceae bacterium]
MTAIAVERAKVAASRPQFFETMIHPSSGTTAPSSPAMKMHRFPTRTAMVAPLAQGL